MKPYLKIFNQTEKKLSFSRNNCVHVYIVFIISYFELFFKNKVIISNHIHILWNTFNQCIVFYLEIETW